MADWRKLCQLLVLADGVIDDTEVKILKKELWADDRIDQEELDFLVELRGMAQKKAKAKGVELQPSFERLVHDAIEKSVVGPEGGISAAKTNWLKEKVFPGKKINEKQKKLLGRLKKGLKRESPEFNALHDQHLGKK
jgi:hypothetical protein